MNPTWIYVFGSNQRGIHGAGSARTARELFGAQRGVGEGRTGRAYAIPTKDYSLAVLPPSAIAANVTRFLAHARTHGEDTFYVTKIGCGLAGYTEDQIAPMFAGAPENCKLPVGWRDLADLAAHEEK